MYCYTNGAPGVLGIWGEWLFIFRELGSTGNYFRGAREQAHNFGDMGSLAKKQIKYGKASILFDFLKISSVSGESIYTMFHDHLYSCYFIISLGN